MNQLNSFKNKFFSKTFWESHSNYLHSNQLNISLNQEREFGVCKCTQSCSLHSALGHYHLPHCKLGFHTTWCPHKTTPAMKRKKIYNFQIVKTVCYYTVVKCNGLRLNDSRLNSSCSVPQSQAAQQDLSDANEALNVSYWRWMWGYRAAHNVLKASQITTWWRNCW